MKPRPLEMGWGIMKYKLLRDGTNEDESRLKVRLLRDGVRG